MRVCVCARARAFHVFQHQCRHSRALQGAGKGKVRRWRQVERRREEIILKEKEEEEEQCRRYKEGGGEASRRQ